MAKSRRADKRSVADKYADQFYKYTREKDFNGVTDDMLQEIVLDNPEFKENFDSILERYNEKYPNSKYTFTNEATSEHGNKWGFAPKPVVEKPPTTIVEQEMGPPVRPGVIGQFFGRPNTVTPIGSPEVPEGARVVNKQPLQTTLSKKEHKEYLERRSSGDIDPADFKGKSLDEQRGVLTDDRTKRQNLSTGGPVLPTKLSSGLDLGADITGMAFDKLMANNTAGYNGRVDPSRTMKTNNRLSGAKDILTSGLTGAAAGSVVPGIGTLAGGIAGVVSGGVKALTSGGKAEREAAVKEYQDKSAHDYSSAIMAAGYKDGGKVTGKGGPKADKVPMEVPEGSFVVPAQNASKAMKLGKQFLGWDSDEKASKKDGPARINASNGEVMFTPEEVEDLDFYGVDVESLAPNAKEGKNLAGGGWAERMSKDPKKRLAPTLTGGFNPDTVSLLQAKAKTKAGEGKEEEKNSSLVEHIPEVFGALQSSAGLFGLATSKNLPDPSVSSELRTLARDTKKISEQGLDPASRNYAMKSIEQNRRAGINDITSRGGSAAEITSGMVGMTSKAMEGHEKIALADDEIRRQNRAPYHEALRLLSSRKDEVGRERRGIKEQKDEMFANLLHSGISNIVGARQYKEHLKFLKDNKSQINLTIPNQNV